MFWFNWLNSWNLCEITEGPPPLVSTLSCALVQVYTELYTCTLVWPHKTQIPVGIYISRHSWPALRQEFPNLSNFTQAFQSSVSCVLGCIGVCAVCTVQCSVIISVLCSVMCSVLCSVKCSVLCSVTCSVLSSVKYSVLCSVLYNVLWSVLVSVQFSVLCSVMCSVLCSVLCSVVQLGHIVAWFTFLSDKIFYTTATSV